MGDIKMVVLCCSSADVPGLSEVVDWLESEPVRVALVADGGPELAEVAGREPQALYVFCEGDDMGAKEIGRLRNQLLRSGVNFGRMLTGPGERPKELRRKIEAALKRSPPKAAPPPLPPTMAGRRTPAGLPPPVSKPKRRAKSAPHEETSASNPADSAADTAVAPLTFKTNEKRSDGEVDAPTGKHPRGLGLHPPPGSSPSALAFDPEPDDSRVAPIPSAKTATPKPPSKLPRPEASFEGSEPSIQIDMSNTDPAIVRPTEDLAPADTSPTPANSLQEAGQPAAPLPVISGHTQQVLLGQTQEQPTVRTAVARTPSPTPPNSTQPSFKTKFDPLLRQGQANPKASIAIAVGGFAALMLLAMVTTTPSTNYVPSAAPVVASARQAATAPASATGPGTNADLLAPPVPEVDLIPPVLSPTPGAVDTVVMQALRSRAVQALDVLLVAPPAKSAVSWHDGQAACDSLVVADLGDWRLPQVGELSSLSAAGMLRRGYYWSSTASDTFGDSHYAWYAGRDRVTPRGSASKVVCVRGQPLGS